MRPSLTASAEAGDVRQPGSQPSNPEQVSAGPEAPQLKAAQVHMAASTQQQALLAMQAKMKSHIPALPASGQRTTQRVAEIQRLASEAPAHGSQPIQLKIPVVGAKKGTMYEQDLATFDVVEIQPPAAVADYDPTPDQAATDPNKTYTGGEAGYLVNMSAMNKVGASPDVNQGDLRASTSVDRYQQGFADPVEAKNRLRMVINVNQYDDPMADNPAATTLNAPLLAERAAVANAHGKACIIGYTWKHGWKRGDNNAQVTVDQVRTARKASKKKAENLAGGYLRRFKFGEMRQKTFSHAATGIFENQLADRDLKVFIHSGDGDVISVKQNGAADGKGIYDRVDAYREKAGKAGIKLIGGGITNQGVKHGGDAPENQSWGIKTAHDIDMSHRESMAGVSGSAPWMTEPNTFIDYATLKGANDAEANWANWKNYLVDFGSALGGLVGQAEADFSFSELSIVSSANTHKLPNPQKVQTTDATLDSAKFAEAIFKHKDTSVHPSAWVRRLASQVVPAIEADADEESEAQRDFGPRLPARAEWLAGKILESKEPGLTNDHIKARLSISRQTQLDDVDANDQKGHAAPPWHDDSVAAVNTMSDNLIAILNEAAALFTAAQAKGDEFTAYGADTDITYAETIAPTVPALIKS
jgi:hypothetical protein